MILTRDFNETFIEYAQREPIFARLMLDHAAMMFLNGEPNASRFILQMLVKGAIGFDVLAEATAIPIDSLQLLLAADNNSGIDQMAIIFNAIRKHLGATLMVNSIDTGSEQDGFEPMDQTRPDAA